MSSPSQSSPDCAVIRKFTAQLRPAPSNGPSCCGFATEDVVCSATGRVVNLTISGIGSFPTDLAVLTELRTFIVKDSLDLTGNMPSSFSSLKNLERLEIVNTRMSGPIPDVFGDMSRLRNLYAPLNAEKPTTNSHLTHESEPRNLRANALSGPVPDSLGKATQLREMSAHLLFPTCPCSSSGH
ncbi:hypothetical protein BCR44DRAFT_323574 [Catenaria anguillulae PL171]|uniref:Uncharacterized protein n=1 Tax=Catenaria anguillulae PL171 TaxID=765915 RepID=A0A1Y2HQX0_9FUNG|nr:hypothetical protein BCR44DRAFT_323574 [Catenaria anguillulae PL171]